MSSYVVLARKWRPAQFADIVGQEPIVRTLMNAIRTDRIHQAYLFTGSRGIGKTSVARILAKAIRCQNRQDQNGFLSSCDQCANCHEITQGNGVDVIEIDGASNNGVDAVREIRESVKFLPSTGKQKIYIIDEVHMLTTAAFNALLKTLEEPPEHILFIFATTEPHKIPATILSRVQRFDYKRVTLAQTQNRLEWIATQESLEVEPAALSLLAKASEGSMRDALSLLDQVIAYAGKTISSQDVRESVGLIQTQVLLEILESVFKRDPLPALEQVEASFEQGFDLRVLAQNLLEILHTVLLCKVGRTKSALLNFSDEEAKKINLISEMRPLEEQELLFQVLHYALDQIAHSPQPKLVLDVVLIKCATAEVLIPIQKSSLDQKKNSPVNPPSLQKARVVPRAEPPRIQEKSAETAPRFSWETIIEAVRKERPLIGSLLEHGAATLKENSLDIAFSEDQRFKRDQLETPTYRSQVVAVLSKVMGRAITITFSSQSSLSESESVADRRTRERDERRDQIKLSVENNPIIREAQSLFGGELGPIEIRETLKEGGNTSRVQ